MTDHSKLLDRYRRAREVQFHLNNLLVKTIPKKTMEECGRKLGFFRKGTLVFETEDELALLMDYCIYHPGPDGRSLVTNYLKKSPPAADSEEMVALQSLTHAYYSLFQVVAVERGVGVSVRDLLRNETGFIVDVGLGNTAKRQAMLATRIIPMDDFLMTGGAALPADASAASRIVMELKLANVLHDTIDFKQLTPQQEAELAALIIRACRAAGMTSRIAYTEPGSPALPMTRGLEGQRRVGRNDPCPCGSGKKFKACCGRA